MIFKKKQKEVVPVWDREEEYQRAYAKMIAAEELYDIATDIQEKENLKAVWLEQKKLFEPLYAQREEWLDKTGARPKAQQKDKITKDAKLAAGVTILGIGLPVVLENRGIIMKGVRDWVQKPKLWRK